MLERPSVDCLLALLIDEGRIEIASEALMHIAKAIGEELAKAHAVLNRHSKSPFWLMVDEGFIYLTALLAKGRKADQIKQRDSSYRDD